MNNERYKKTKKFIYLPSNKRYWYFFLGKAVTLESNKPRFPHWTVYIKRSQFDWKFNCNETDTRRVCEVQVNIRGRDKKSSCGDFTNTKGRVSSGVITVTETVKGSTLLFHTCRNYFSTSAPCLISVNLKEMKARGKLVMYRVSELNLIYLSSNK